MGKQFGPGWIGSLTESEQAIGVPFRVVAGRAVSPPCPQVPKYRSVQHQSMTYGTTSSEQASAGSCPGPSYVPQSPSHDREPPSSVQLAQFPSFWSQGIWRCTAERFVCILSMLFMDLQPFLLPFCAVGQQQ